MNIHETVVRILNPTLGIYQFVLILANNSEDQCEIMADLGNTLYYEVRHALIVRAPPYAPLTTSVAFRTQLETLLRDCISAYEDRVGAEL